MTVVHTRKPKPRTKARLKAAPLSIAEYRDVTDNPAAGEGDCLSHSDNSCNE